MNRQQKKKLAHLDNILCPVINLLVISLLDQVDRSKTSLTQGLSYRPLPTPAIVLCWNQD